MMTPMQEMLFERCEPLPWCGCWIWMLALQKNGYPKWTNGKLAHRVSYKVFKGSITPGYHIAHAHNCASRACINPEHLIQLSPREHRDYDLYERYTF